MTETPSRRTNKRVVTGYLTPEEEELWNSFKIGFGVETDADVIRYLIREKARYIQSGEAKLEKVLETVQATSTKIDTVLLLIAKK